MKVRPKWLVLSVALGSCQRDAQLEHPTCDVNATAITDSSIGPLYLGEAASALAVRCVAVSDTTVVVAMAGWVDTIPAKRLVVVGSPVLATHEGEKIIALRVSAPGFRTADTIEVGTGIARFRNRLGIRVSPSEHSGIALLQDRAHCGKTFELSGWGPVPPLPDDPPVTGSGLVTWPDSVRVTAIVVAGCKNPSTNQAVDSAFDIREDSAPRGDTLAIAAPTLPSPTLTPSAPPPVNPAPRPTTVPGPARTPTSPATIAASSAELAELRRLLGVPVQGVTRSQLRDTYAESRGTRLHEALDIRAPRGTPVLSAADGKVMRLFDSKTGGLMVYAADPTDGFVLLYGHLDRYADGLRDGMPLRRGQVIGYVGTTGNAPIATPHLHFGILRGKPSAAWSRGVAVNPYPLLVP
jgi:murein DD-endopeptidase MepM/ murein hydrolase activator NlpD